MEPRERFIPWANVMTLYVRNDILTIYERKTASARSTSHVGTPVARVGRAVRVGGYEKMGTDLFMKIGAGLTTGNNTTTFS